MLYLKIIFVAVLWVWMLFILGNGYDDIMGKKNEIHFYLLVR